ASPDRLPQTADLCSPNPCQNRAICRTHRDGYSCFCVPGYQGAHCQVDVNECISQPCRNGATCVDRVGRFSCLCPPGFTGLSALECRTSAGPTCEVQIDECQSQPCLSGGSCHDYAGGFTCTCRPGFQGHRYSCDCSHTAFTGKHCETPLPPCLSEPCFNSAICKDIQGNYTCECWPGFEGHQCEIDITECSSSPAGTEAAALRGHGRPCMAVSLCSLCTMTYSMLQATSAAVLQGQQVSRHAEKYDVVVGSLCQEVIDQCDPSPCQNGGRCESHVGGYVCHCLQQSHDGTLYGGVNCDVRLVGCEGHECQNQGSCSPFLLDGTHGYTCFCSAGYTGPLCKTPTTFSFERKGYLLLQSPLVDAEVSCNITLSFKTVLPRAVLFQRNNRGLLLSLELEGASFVSHSGRKLKQRLPSSFWSFHTLSQMDSGIL
ncbi:hypothetical protein INR49_025329, partial [Caranx melampygus]